MRIEFFDCEREGLLRRTAPSKENAVKSVGKAAALVAEAEKDFANGCYSSSVLVSYAAMFHSARALLIQDGWREKSHACVARYVEEKYVKTRKLEQVWVDLLDRFRELRHSDLYDLEFTASREQAAEAFSVAKQFCERLKKLV